MCVSERVCTKHLAVEWVRVQHQRTTERTRASFFARIRVVSSRSFVYVRARFESIEALGPCVCHSESLRVRTAVLSNIVSQQREWARKSVTYTYSHRNCAQLRPCVWVWSHTKKYLIFEAEHYIRIHKHTHILINTEEKKKKKNTQPSSTTFGNQKSKSTWRKKISKMSLPINSLYSLTWGDYGTSLVSAVQLLRCHGDLVDCTLAAGGRSFPAHKIVLCAASPFLLDLLKVSNASPRNKTEDKKSIKITISN